MLRAQGCDVVGPFSNLETGLTAARSAAIDGAVLDVNLRGYPVFPIADALRARGIPFVFCTGYAASSTVMLRAYDGVPRLEKPFEEATLVEAIRRHFRSDQRQATPA